MMKTLLSLFLLGGLLPMAAVADDTAADTQAAETKVGRALEKCRYLTEARPAKDAKKYIFVQMSDDSPLKSAALPTVLAVKLSLQQNGESTMVMLAHVDKKKSGNPYEMTGLPVVAMDKHTKIPGVKRSEEPLTVTIVDDDGKECYEELDILEQTAISPLLNMAGGLPNPAELIPGGLGIPSPF